MWGEILVDKGRVTRDTIYENFASPEGSFMSYVTRENGVTIH